MSYSALGLQNNSYEVSPAANAPITPWMEKAARDCQPPGPQHHRVTHPGLRMPAETFDPSRTGNRPFRGLGIFRHQLCAGGRMLAAGRATQIPSVSQTASLRFAKQAAGVLGTHCRLGAPVGPRVRSWCLGGVGSAVCLPCRPPGCQDSSVPGAEPGWSTHLPAPRAQELLLSWTTRNEVHGLHTSVFWPRSPSR